MEQARQCGSGLDGTEEISAVNFEQGRAEEWEQRNRSWTCHLSFVIDRLNLLVGPFIQKSVRAVGGVYSKSWDLMDV